MALLEDYFETYLPYSRGLSQPKHDKIIQTKLLTIASLYAGC